MSITEAPARDRGTGLAQPVARGRGWRLGGRWPRSHPVTFTVPGISRVSWLSACWAGRSSPGRADQVAAKLSEVNCTE